MEYATMVRTKGPKIDQAGFSLVEILIAVTIVVLMGGVVAINVFPFLFQSQRDRAVIDIGVMKTTVKLFQTVELRLPRDSEWPEFLISGSKRHADPYLDEDKVTDGQVLDPWDNPYVYRRINNRKFEIMSYGADGQPGGEGDDEDISSKKNKR